MADDSSNVDSTTTGNSDGSSSTDTTTETAVLVHKLYRYHVEAFELIVPTLTNPVKLETGSINRISIEKDFDHGFYPIFRIWCAINPRLKEYIMFNKNEIKFRIRLQCDIVNVSTGLTEASEDVFNAMFIPIIGDASPFYDNAIYEATAEKVTEMSDSGATANDLAGNNPTGDARETVEYYLYAENDLFNSKAIVNNVYAGNNLASILVSLLSENGFDAILMSPSDNDGDFDQVVVPPMNLLNVFKYFSETYGLHSTGTSAFFDYRCLYILNRSGHPDCVEEGEYPKTIYTIHETKNSEALLAGTLACDLNKEYHIYPDPHKVKIMNFSAYNDHINGNSLTMINSKDNSSATIGGTGDQRGSGVTRVENNNNGNAYAKTDYANAVSENNKKLRVTFNDVYFWALTPNKEHIWNWMDSRLSADYSGVYRPLQTNFWFQNRGGSLSLTVTAEYAKKEDISAADKAAIDKEVTPLTSTGSATTASNVDASTSSSTTTTTTTTSSAIGANVK